MSELRSEAAPAQSAADTPPVYFDARRQLAASFLAGDGLEIGPLHQPLAMPASAHVRYVDRMSVEDLRREYPELADWNLTRVDVVDDGEKLATIAADSQDFIVANHFLEHTENPIATIATHLEKLRPGGVLFYAVPDKRYTFDFRRHPTPLAHMVGDYENGPEGSRAGHYDEWTRLVVVEETDGTEAGIVTRARELEAAAYSIHMHVWTQAEFLALILDIRARTGEAFDLEASAKQGLEYIVVLRKAGAHPPPPSPVLPPKLSFGARVQRKLRTLADRNG
jgi:SAM-dependent methyltransferase